MQCGCLGALRDWRLDICAGADEIGLSQRITRTWLPYASLAEI